MSGPDLRRITEEVARRPDSWPLFRSAVRDEFDRSAAAYEARLGPDHAEPLRAALAGIPVPRRALDVGTGTGVGTEVLTETYPSAWVCGVDLSLRMIRACLSKRRAHPVHLAVGDASALPFTDASFDLVVSIAVPVFAGELARVLVEGGVAIVTFPRGDATPIYLSPGELERLLRRQGFDHIEHGRAGRGTFSRSRKA